MSNTEKLDNARAHALAQVETIRELVAALRCDFDRLEELRESRAQCGTVMHGTLRLQDLIPAFLEKLGEVDPAAYQQTIERAIPAYAEEDEKADWWESEDAMALLESLTDALNNAAPEGCHFGAHIGDGSDLGFWLTEEAAEELEELEKTAAEFESEEDARQRIEESALSVEVRTGWTTLDTMPGFSEFRIVLCTGGPHVEIRGELGAYNKPQYPRVLFSDWFRELEELEIDAEDKDALQAFCECFYFGE